MKLCRYGNPGSEKLGVFDRKLQLRDLSGIVSDLTPETLPTVINSFRNDEDTEHLPLVFGTLRLGAPLKYVSKFIGVGLNYLDHAKEPNLPVPDEPVIFLKAPSCISGSDDTNVLPPHSRKADWEAELGVVIGRPAMQISPPEALDYVADYCIVNDVLTGEAVSVFPVG